MSLLEGPWTVLDGWRWGTISEVTSAHAAEATLEPGVLYDYWDEEGDAWSRPGQRLGRDIPVHSRWVAPGDVLVANFHDRRIRVAWAAIRGVAAPGWLILRPGQEATPAYIAWYLRAAASLFSREQRRNFASADRNLGTVPIPLPMMAVLSDCQLLQDKLAGWMEATHAVWRDACNQAQDIRSTAEMLLEVVIAETFAQEATVEWHKAPFGELAQVFGGKGSAHPDVSPARLLTVSDVGRKRQGGPDIDWDSVGYCPPSEVLSEDRRLRAGDIVMNRVGNHCGRTYLLTSVPVATYGGGNLLRIQPDENVVDSAFLYWATKSPSFQAAVDRVKPGSLQASIAIRDVSDIPVSFPSQVKQLAIAARLRLIAQEMETVRQDQIIAAHLLVELEQGLYRRAFWADEV